MQTVVGRQASPNTDTFRPVSKPLLELRPRRRAGRTRHKTLRPRLALELTFLPLPLGSKRRVSSGTSPPYEVVPCLPEVALRRIRVRLAKTFVHADAGLKCADVLLVDAPTARHRTRPIERKVAARLVARPTLP